MRIKSVCFILCVVSTIACLFAQQPPPEGEFDPLSFRNIGPSLMSGRIADIAIDPRNRNTWFVAVGSGGVWKTINAGTNWTPIFDRQSSYSIGCISIDPTNSSVIWVGTGENVSGRHVGFGDGVYKSVDGGKTWNNMGLPDSEHISRILIDPRDPKRVFVASEGPLWSDGGERGVFRTIDGGETWVPVLQISSLTGITDLEFDPESPDALYAAAYQRRRHIWSLISGGPESGIYKSLDGGDNWQRLSRGLPEGHMGKIGLAVSPQDRKVVYATIEANPEERGFYRSLDGGESWEKRNSYTSGGTGPHYYQEIYASPHKRDRVYQMDVWIQVTEDGGSTFKLLGEADKHSDNHALAFVKGDEDYLLAGSDGGLYESFDHAQSWRFIGNLPITQIYKMAVDNDFPFYNVAGGTQDNGTIYGPTRTSSAHGIQNRDWLVPYGADGYACQIDPEDPNIIYLEWQIGNLLRYDRKTQEIIDIKPMPGESDPPERWNWDAPILVSPHENERLYFASQRVWRSDDRGDSWRTISRDLTRNLNRYDLPVMGRVQSVDAAYDNGAMSLYSTITSLAESPRVEGLLYTGSDDGVVAVREGSDWRMIEGLTGIPAGAFVNDVKASFHADDTVFAAFSNHKVGDFRAYLLKSVDRGQSWTSIAGDLPDRHLVWRLAEDHVDPNLLFAATEFGIFFTSDGGTHWIQLGGGVPTIAFRDLVIQRRESDLVGASFGRGFFVLDDYSPLRHVDAELWDSPGGLFPIRDALLYVESVDLGVRGRGYQGGNHYTAPNPPFGALITFYLGEIPETAKDRRETAEAELIQASKDVPFPGYSSLEAESLESGPKVVVTIREESGQEVRRILAPAKKGLSRIHWNLRYPPPFAIEIETGSAPPPWADPEEGPFVIPGIYSAEVGLLVVGAYRAVGERQSFRVTKVAEPSLAGGEPAAVLAFQQSVAELQRNSEAAFNRVSELQQQMRYMEKAVIDTPSADTAWLGRLDSMRREAHEIIKILSGDPTPGRLNEASKPSILGRLGQIISGHWFASTHGPTQTHRQSFAIAERQYRGVASRLRSLVGESQRLQADLVRAGAPYIPGRP